MEEAITNSHLILSTYKVKGILEFTITKKMNEHSVLNLVAIHDKEDRKHETDNPIYRTNNLTPITLSYREKKEKKVLFQGRVVDIQLESNGDVEYLKLYAYSNTYQLDIKKHSRTFQNTSMTTHEVIREVLKSYDNVDPIFNIEEKAINKLVVQYEETDWEFLLRFTSLYGASIVPDITSKKCALYIGIPQKTMTYKAKAVQYTISKSLEQYLMMKRNGYPELTEADFTFFKVEDRQIFQLGNEVKFQGKVLRVAQAYHVLEKGMLTNIYVLKQKNGCKRLHYANQGIVGISLSGQVMGVSRDKVRVRLAIDKKNNAEYWFPYSTMSASPDGSGWYCMPEKGDSVRVYFPTDEEGDAYAVSAISSYQPKAGDTKDSMENPNVKYLQTTNDQAIRFQEDGIIINSGSGQATIFLSNSGEIQIYAENSIQVTATEQLSLISQENLVLGAMEEISIKKGENASITLNKDGNIELKGTKIYSNNG